MDEESPFPFYSEDNSELINFFGLIHGAFYFPRRDEVIPSRL